MLTTSKNISLSQPVSTHLLKLIDRCELHPWAARVWKPALPLAWALSFFRTWWRAGTSVCHSSSKTTDPSLTLCMSDQAIMSEEERLVVIRFGRDYDPDCMRQDEVLYRSSSLKSLISFSTNTVVQVSQIVSRTSQSSTSATLIRCPISNKCTSYTTLWPSCSSSGTNIWCVISVPETTINWTGSLRISRSWSISWRPYIEGQKRAEVWSLVQRVSIPSQRNKKYLLIWLQITRPGTDTKLLIMLWWSTLGRLHSQVCKCWTIMGEATRRCVLWISPFPDEEHEASLTANGTTYCERQHSAKTKITSLQGLHLP